jgi:hypothetical protein
MPILYVIGATCLISLLGLAYVLLFKSSGAPSANASTALTSNANATTNSVTNTSLSVSNPPIGRDEAERFLAIWKQAWEAKDLYTYASYYGDDFVGRNYSSTSGLISMTRAQWLKDKEQKFRRSSVISVNIGQLSMRADGNNTAVSFTQSFRSDTYHDRGIKTLLLRRTPSGQIKIIGEDFVPS